MEKKQFKYSLWCTMAFALVLLVLFLFYYFGGIEVSTHDLKTNVFGVDTLLGGDRH